jgi:hypothetical protein
VQVALAGNQHIQPCFGVTPIPSGPSMSGARSPKSWSKPSRAIAVVAPRPSSGRVRSSARRGPARALGAPAFHQVHGDHELRQRRRVDGCGRQRAERRLVGGAVQHRDRERGPPDATACAASAGPVSYSGSGGSSGTGAAEVAGAERWRDTPGPTTRAHVCFITTTIRSSRVVPLTWEIHHTLTLHTPAAATSADGCDRRQGSRHARSRAAAGRPWREKSREPRRTDVRARHDRRTEHRARRW